MIKNRTTFGKTVMWVLMLVVVFSFAACGEKDNTETGSETDVITVGTKPMTESRILGEMLKILIENEGYQVEITKDIAGGTTNIMPAMENGEIDLYPEYTGTGWLTVLKKEDVPKDSDELFEQLNEEYGKTYNMEWVGLYGFNNTYAFTVSDGIAEEYDLKTMSDLAEVSDKIIFGGNGDYMERADGFDAVAEEYGYNFKDVMDIDMGLKYEALKNGDIDVTNGFTTDAQLSEVPVTVLEDDKNFFEEYLASTVVRKDTLEKFPKLKDALMKLNSQITNEEMIEMNYRVEVAKEDEKTVASEYINSKNLL